MFSNRTFPKKTVPTRISHCAVIALQKFHSDHCLKHFCEFPNNISFSFLLQKNKPTQSATIVLTLWIYRKEDKLQCCILVWRDSKKRCVHYNQPIVRIVSRGPCNGDLHFAHGGRFQKLFNDRGEIISDLGYSTSFPRPATKTNHV